MYIYTYIYLKIQAIHHCDKAIYNTLRTSLVGRGLLGLLMLVNYLNKIHSVRSCHAVMDNARQRLQSFVACFALFRMPTPYCSKIKFSQIEDVHRRAV